jgi:hypothetical protein
MSNATNSVGQSRVVAFFCTLFALTSDGVFFALAQYMFILFTGSAAWYLYRSKKTGWYLRLGFSYNEFD